MRKLIATVTLSLVIPLVSAGPGGAGVVVEAPGSTVAGKTIGEWTGEWWSWAVANSVPHDPLTDATGAQANVNQSGPVFFVAGNTGGATVRSFTVPFDKYLLVPLLNVELSQLELGFGTSGADVRTQVIGFADLIDELHASIDGVPVPDLFLHREVSPDFSFSAALGNSFGIATGPSGIAVADGYWLMLAPIPFGETHVLNFGGGVSSFGFSLDVTDTITSVPEPGSWMLACLGAAGMVGAAWRKKAIR